MAKNLRILAVASAGGHWTQLMRLRPALKESDLAFVSTRPMRDGIGQSRFYCVPDANKSNKLKVIVLALRMLQVVLFERPDLVITTGAAPGYIALRFARVFGARTIWIDSMANVNQLSLSGRMALKYADVCLTQWPQLVRPEGPHFVGAVV